MAVGLLRILTIIPSFLKVRCPTLHRHLHFVQTLRNTKGRNAAAELASLHEYAQQRLFLLKGSSL